MTSITEKIRKVLELGRRGGTEAEGETAMRMAHELLAKHNLQMSDVEELEVKDEDVMEQAIDRSARNNSWQDVIYYAVCKLYFCHVYTSAYSLAGKRRSRYVIVGKPCNMQTAREVISYLLSLGEELSAGGDALYRNSWRNGYASRISERALELRRNSIKKLPGAETKALVVANIYALAERQCDDYLRAQGLRFRSSSRYTRSRDAAGYNAGREAGGAVSLSRGAVGRISC